jgi:hypothetical protein
MPDIDKELEKIKKGEAWDESDEAVQVEVKKPLKTIIRITGRNKYTNLKKSLRIHK